MNQLLRTLGPLKPEIKLSQALQQFRRKLEDHQIRSFEAFSKDEMPQPRDVAAVAADIDNRIKWKRSQSYYPRLEGFLGNIQKFVSIADLVVGGSQNMPAIAVWSAIRFCLTAFCDAVELLDKLSEVLRDIFKACPVQQAFIQLYPSSRELQTISYEYTTASLELFTNALGFLNRYKRGLFKAGIKGFEGSFGAQVKELQDCAKRMKRQLSLLSHETIIDIKQKGDKLLNIEASKQQRARAQARLRFLEKCSSQNQWSVQKYLRAKGTPQWLFDQPTYERWKCASRSAILWCTGIIGSGKSVLAANVVTEIQAAGDAAALGYFFVRSDESESMRYDTIIGSIARQLFEPIQFPTDERIESFEGKQLSIDVIESLLSDLPKSPKPYCIIIDGLDDCEKNTCKAVAWLLGRLIQQEAITFRIYLSTRPDLLPKLVDLITPSFIVLMREGDHEMDSYIRGEIERRKSLTSWPFEDDHHNEVLLDTLLLGSQGMFLWVAFQLDAIGEAATEAQALEVLKELPKDLPETFDRVLRKLHTPSGLKLRKKLFEFVLTARRPLTLEELAESLSVVPGKTEWDPQHVVKKPRQMVINYGGSLLDIDDERLTVHYAHPSVGQHLISSLATDLEAYSIKEQYADMHLGEVCVTYLNFGQFEKQVTLRPKMEEPEENEIKVTKLAGREVAKSKIGHVAMWLKNGANEPQKFDLASQLHKLQTVPSKPIFEDSDFLQYAKSYWLTHTTHLKPPEDSIREDSLEQPYQLWVHLLAGSLSVVTLPWDPEYWKEVKDVCVDWAYEHQHFALLRLLFERATESCYDENSSYRLVTRFKPNEHFHAIVQYEPDIVGSILVAAARVNHRGLVKFLVETCGVHVDTESKGSMRTALQAASMALNLPLMKFLVSHGANVNAPSGKSGSALSLASQGIISSNNSESRETAVSFLLGQGADVNATGGDMGSALQAAFVTQNLAVVHLLLQQHNVRDYLNVECGTFGTILIAAMHIEDIPLINRLVELGADVNLEVQGSPQTPLIAACNINNIAGTHFLIDCGAAVNHVCSDNTTALAAAARNGSVELVDLLLRHGANANEQFSTEVSTPLSDAVRRNKIDIVRLLLTNGADPNVGIYPGGRIVHVAASQGHKDMVEVLLKAGANPLLYSLRGNAIEQAERNGHTDVVVLLQSRATTQEMGVPKR